MLKLFYGIINSSLLCCEQFVSGIKKFFYVVNPCKPYVDNNIINYEQHVITWHAYDSKSVRIRPKVSDDFASWCK